MLTVYAIPVSLYCAKLRIVLRHKQLAWRELAPPGGYGSAAYKALVPSGNLPALVDGDLLLADSEAIAEYLEECHPEPPLLPASARARARVRERSRFHDTRLEPELRRLFPGLRSGLDPARVKAQGEAIHQRLEQLGRMLGDDDGGTLTLGDCGMPITFAWLDALDPRIGLGLQWPAAVRDYRGRLAGQAAVAAELAEYRARLEDWLDEDVNT